MSEKDVEQISQQLTTVENLLRKRLAGESYRAKTAEERASQLGRELSESLDALGEASKEIDHLRQQRDRLMDANKALRKSSNTVVA